MPKTSINIDWLKEEIPYKWKIQNYNFDRTKATCVAYIDARDVMNRLDDVVWPGNWQDKYYEAHWRLICSLWIKFDDEWIWKSDTGSEAKGEWEKSLVSDAFKRAAVKWWIWRFLYDLDIKWISWDESRKKPIDDNWKIIYDITDYFRKQDSKAVTNEIDLDEYRSDLSWKLIDKKVFDFSKSRYWVALDFDEQKKADKYPLKWDDLLKKLKEEENTLF